MAFIYALPANPKVRFRAFTVSSPEAETDFNRCTAGVDGGASTDRNGSI